MQEGDTVKVRTAGRTFDGWLGRIIHITQSRGGQLFYWVYFPGHPWQQRDTRPFAFRREELRDG